MRIRVTVLILAALAILVASGCRSRRTVPQPQAVPVEPAAVPTPTVEVEAPEADFPQLTRDTGDVLSEDIMEADRLARERGWIRDAFFAFDTSTLDDAAQNALRQSATWLRSHPELLIHVEGHCDERGTEQYNLALGDRRATTAATYLETLGVDLSRIRTVSYGEERPFEDGSSEEAWAQNRRAHLVLAGRHQSGDR